MTIAILTAALCLITIAFLSIDKASHRQFSEAFAYILGGLIVIVPIIIGLALIPSTAGYTCPHILCSTDRHGIVDPGKVGKDGRPVPVDGLVLEERIPFYRRDAAQIGGVTSEPNAQRAGHQVAMSGVKESPDQMGNPSTQGAGGERPATALPTIDSVSDDASNLLIVCSNGDQATSEYRQAEDAFLARFVSQKGALLLPNTKVRIFAKPGASLPDVNNQSATYTYLSVLVSLMGIDPQEARLSWKAEMFDELGYTFVTFLCTADNPSYSFAFLRD
jgi:hypothetical protein